MIAHIISFIAFTSVLAPNVANVKAAAILPRKYERFRNTFELNSDGKLVPFNGLYPRAKFSFFPDISTSCVDPCNCSGERYVYGQTVTHVENNVYLPPRSPGTITCCVDNCGRTEGQTLTESKTFSIGFNVGGDASNLAAAAADAGRQISSAGGFDFSYSWSTSFSTVSSSECHVDSTYPVGPGETYTELCMKQQFAAQVRRTHFDVTRSNLCDVDPQSEVVEYDATTDEPLRENGLGVGNWDCFPCDDSEKPDNMRTCTAPAGVAPTGR